MGGYFGDVPPRLGILLAGFIVVMAAAPLVVGDYILSLLILVLYFAYLGQAWNVMMGFAGQLSLGHSLYLGLGAYSAAALFVHFGLSPWIGVVIGAGLAALAGSLIATLGFRFGVRGVYFALLTIAFAEFTRILFDHFAWVGASAGLFLPVTNRTTDDLWRLRGSTTMFYYVALAMTLAALALCYGLLRQKIGYYWQAIREDQGAAQALGIDVFRYKLAAVVISAAMTAVAGVFYAFYYNNLYPESTFAMHRSIELLLGPIIGGLGTLGGPIVGAFVLTGLGEALTFATEGIRLDGIKQLAYGLSLLVIVVFVPRGIWPWLRDWLRLNGPSKAGP